MHQTHCPCPCHHAEHPKPTTGHTPKPPPACGCGDSCHRCGGTPVDPRCPPPPQPCDPRTVTLPPHDPPPHVHTGSGTDRPGTGDRPGKGEPGEGPWFRGQVKGIENGGATFGPRKNEYLPYLVMRANPGDRGARALPGVFWESPDIFLHSGVKAENAPLMPPDAGDVATASSPTALYAHVWNLGRAPVWGAYVEFSWFNPSLGLSYANANRIGAAMVDLGDRFTNFGEWREAIGPAGDRYLTRGCHAIVRCPDTWVPTFENAGHECLVVRVFEPFMDAIKLTDYDAKRNRKIGQRNISVVQAQSPAEIDLLLDVPPGAAPGTVEVDVTVDQPASMPWLQLYVGAGKPMPTSATSAVVAGLLPPTLAGARTIDLSALAADQRQQFLTERERFHLGCDPARIGLHASTEGLRAGQAHVVRVRQRQAGEIIGGYTVVLVGPD
jgi:hypothetical protein